MFTYIYRTGKKIKYKIKLKSKKIITKYQLKKKYKEWELKIWINLPDIIYYSLFFYSCIYIGFMVSFAINYYHPPVQGEVWLGVIPGKEYSHKYKT